MGMDYDDYGELLDKLTQPPVNSEPEPPKPPSICLSFEDVIEYANLELEQLNDVAAIAFNAQSMLLPILTEVFYQEKTRMAGRMRTITELEYYGIPTLVAESFYNDIRDRVLNKVLRHYPNGVHQVDTGFSFMTPMDVLFMPVRLSEVKHGRWG
ncbi:hypothetical protein PP187_gp076 [Klebsiella phage vB_KvM-Eowyn]|uniref:Uncharacterized protein n=1 Tax=Klebsiella phage vB_KvM-Eowyn TaxID=2762819 RepID=A0A7R8R5E6_9CAUD|nr:hypothetical protein PP187_gp076 [Klebsiella phage vB_KvM-Eowyn]CAD5236065.1 hypothetical protein LLCLJKAH_00076 [Klebsiella phage vB_KvM-Eowyn]